jgi:2',3'-cyclic-nucleotide 2'-phosphodiesterase (5'-nucleotidase family)
MTEGLNAGVITKGDVLDVCKSMHTPVVMEITGKQLAGLIKESYNDEIISKPVYGSGFRPHGIAIGKLEFAGVTWEKHNDRITQIFVNNEQLDLHQMYSAGTGTAMLYEEVCGYPSVVGNTMTKIGKDIMVKDVLIGYMKKRHSFLNKTTV